jgi:hypothetical protein
MGCQSNFFNKHQVKEKQKGEGRNEVDNSQNKYQTKQTEWCIYGNKGKEHCRGKMDFAGLKCRVPEWQYL